MDWPWKRQPPPPKDDPWGGATHTWGEAPPTAEPTEDKTWGGHARTAATAAAAAGKGFWTGSSLTWSGGIKPGTKSVGEKFWSGETTNW